MDGKTILVIEDDPAINSLVVSLLDDEGYNVYSAMNGREALNLLASMQPSLILVDLMMPVMDGKTFVRTIKQDSQMQQVPIVVFSADNRAREVIADLNVNAFVPKPFDLNHVSEVVQTYAA